MESSLLPSLSSARFSPTLFFVQVIRGNLGNELIELWRAFNRPECNHTLGLDFDNQIVSLTELGLLCNIFRDTYSQAVTPPYHLYPCRHDTPPYQSVDTPYIRT